MRVSRCVKWPLQVFDSEDRSLSLKSLAGQVVILLYESRDSTEQNRIFKDHLIALKQKGGDFRVVPIVDCSSASLWFKGIWKGQIREHSVKEGVDIYCDWTGDAGKAYASNPGVSNVYVIDKGGLLQYQHTGAVPSSDMPKIKSLLDAR